MELTAGLDHVGEDGYRLYMAAIKEPT